jgi:hypothetical protein
MKLLFYVTLLFIIFHVWYGESEAGSHQCLANSLKVNLTTKCNDAFCVRKNIEDFNNCIADNCNRYGCGQADFLLNAKNSCDGIWGAYCCATIFFARECSQSDREVYEFSIENEAQNIESEMCTNYPRILFDCKKVNFGKLLNE